MLALSVLSACLQKKFSVSVFNDASLIETLNLWTLSTSSAAHKKTVLAALLKPVTSREQEIIEQVKTGIDIDILDDFSQATVRKLTKMAARVEAEALAEPRNWDTKSKHGQAQDLLCKASTVKENKPFPIPSSKMVITNDITSKNLQTKLVEYFGQLAIISDDSNLLKCLNLPEVLRGYNGGGEQRIKVKDRYVTVNHITATVGLIVPPEALAALKSKKYTYGKEVASKLLYYMPASNAGRHNYLDREVAPDQARLGYEIGIDFLLKIQIPHSYNATGDWLPKIIGLDDESLYLFYQFCEQLQLESGKGGNLEALQDWLDNLPGMVLRIAGLVHVANLVQEQLGIAIKLPEDQRSEHMHPLTLSPLSPFWGENLSNNLVIKKETMQSVIEFAKKMIFHAQAAYNILEANKTDADINYVLYWIFRHCEVDANGAFFIRQNKLQRDSHFSKKSITTIKKLLMQLHEQHILSPDELKTRKPTYIWYVNPELFKCKVKEKFQLITGGFKSLPYAKVS